MIFARQRSERTRKKSENFEFFCIFGGRNFVNHRSDGEFMKKAVLLISAIFLVSLIALVAAKFFIVMPWENAELPKLENPRLVVQKSARRLQVFDGEKLIKTYKIVLGFAPVGDKQTEGDGKTPEGEFYVFTKNPNSKFYLSLGVSYPNAEAARRGLRENIITQAENDQILRAVAEKRTPPQKTALGGEIYIHGGGGTAADWTEGCIALRDEEMKELFDAIPVGARVKIEP
jgi:murein L,D-transpeptidase YafK